MSTIEMVWSTRVMLPHSSVAEKVRIRVYSLSQSPAISMDVTSTDVALQRSEAVAISKISASLHSIV